MQRRAFQIRLLAAASALLLVSSCGEKPNSAGSLSPPADLLSHVDEPEMSADSLSSEQVYENERTAKIEWGRDNADVIDRACQWFRTAGVKALVCRRPQQR